MNQESFQQTLRESQRRLQTLMSNLPGMAYRCANDPEWTMEFVSEGCLALTGYTAEELNHNRRCSYASLVHADDRQRIWDEVQAALAKKQPFRLVYRIITAGGEEKSVWEQGCGVFSADGRLQALEGFIVDVTEQRRAEKLLKESEARFRLLYENAPLGYQSLNEEGRLIEVNRAWLDLLGYSREDVLGRWFGDFLAEPDVECFRQRFPRFKEIGEIHGYEFVMVRKDGTPVSVSFDGKIARDAAGRFKQTHCIFRDITAEKRTEDALLRANRALHAVNDCNQALVRATEESALLDNVCRIIVEVTGYHMAWVGYSVLDEKKTVRPVASAGHVEGYLERVNVTYADVERGRGPTGTAIRTGSPCVVRNTYADARFTPWQVEAAERGYRSVLGMPLLVDSRAFGALTIYAAENDAFDEEEIRLLVGLANNLAYGILALRTRDERVEAEEAARSAQEKLLELQKRETERVTAELERVRGELVRKTQLATIGQLSASIAHELRNPLGIVRNAAFYLRRKVPPTEPKWREYLDIIEAETGTAEQIITDLLALTGGKPPLKAALDLGETIHHVIQRLNPPEEVQWCIDMGPEPRIVHADASQLRQVFTNLFTNAIQAMQGAGSITVHTAQDARFDEICVTDEGPGVPAAHRQRVFEPLFTTKAKGTGLGLAVCRQIVEGHGGTIELEDDGQRGAAFRVRLPRK